MWLETGNINTRLNRGTDDERVWLREYLSFRNPNARYSGAPERTVMVNPITDTFPAGFLPLVARAAKEAGFDVEILDRRTCPVDEDRGADLDWLRDYQMDAVQASSTACRGIVHAPTGAGKTEIATGLTRLRPCRWLLLVHRTTLAEQAADRYELRNGEHGLHLPPAGRIGEGQWSVPADCSYVCATFQTLVAALKKKDPRATKLLEWAQGVIVDECHTLPSTTFWGVMQSFSNAYFRIGLSGTPLARGDKRSLLAIAATGEVVYRIKTEVLIEQEVLARPTIHMVEMPHRFSGENFQDVYEHEVTNSKKRNELVALLAAKAEKPAFVFVKEKHHGALLVKAIERAGMQVRFIFGNHAVKQRTHAIGELVAGRLDVLVCSVVFQEGIDVPSLRSVVIASGGKSVIAALQRIGRGMRVEKKGGAVVKDTFDVYDVADIGCGCDKAARDLGTPGKGLHNSCRWLTRHTRERERAYISEGHAVHREPHPLL